MAAPWPDDRVRVVSARHRRYGRERESGARKLIRFDLSPAAAQPYTAGVWQGPSPLSLHGAGDAPNALAGESSRLEAVVKARRLAIV
jgi:hypothetical protein